MKPHKEQFNDLSLGWAGVLRVVEGHLLLKTDQNDISSWRFQRSSELCFQRSVPTGDMLPPCRTYSILHSDALPWKQDLGASMHRVAKSSYHVQQKSLTRWLVDACWLDASIESETTWQTPSSMTYALDFELHDALASAPSLTPARVAAFVSSNNSLALMANTSSHTWKTNSNSFKHD